MADTRPAGDAPQRGRGWRAYAWLALALAVVLTAALPGYYNRRDLFSHWIRKDQPANRVCTHACCRGMRAHPDNYPVVKRNRYLRSASDQQVADYYSRHGGDTPRDAAARDQALAEMQRRDIQRERREAAEDRRRARWSARKADRAAVIENEWLVAEAQTKGVMVNRRGREAGIDPRSLFTGPESRARKYASEELLNYWEYHPRPTEAFFQGQDTRIGSGRMLAPRRRMTSEEQAWRDRYERDIGWPIEAGRHAEAA